MSATWIDKNAYEALGEDQEVSICSGPQVLQVTSGRVLESFASPFTLLQKDFQENAIVEDVLTRDGFEETENADVLLQYENVHSQFTEIAPSICHCYTQEQNYSERYQNKSEVIHAENFVRETQSVQYQKLQDRLDLNVPASLSVNVSEAVMRQVNYRNLTVGRQVVSGRSYQVGHEKLGLVSEGSVIRVYGRCQFGSGSLELGF